MTSTSTPTAPTESPSNTEEYLSQLITQQEAQLTAATAATAVTSQEELMPPSNSLPEDWQGLEHFMKQVDGEGEDKKMQLICQKYNEKTLQVQTETLLNP